MSLVLGSQGGHTVIGLAATNSREMPECVSCSIVGLYNVLSGIEYVTVEGDKQCLVRLHGPNVEVVWKRGQVDAVIRLSIAEYRHVLRCMNEGTRGAA